MRSNVALGGFLPPAPSETRNYRGVHLHALIFRIRQDDGTSQPVGDAGTRPGCGALAPPRP